MKREEKNFLVCHTTNWLSCFRGGKICISFATSFSLTTVFTVTRKLKLHTRVSGKGHETPIRFSSIHACMQKMKEALKLISRPLRLPNDDDGQFSNRFLLVRQKNSSERVHWSEAWGNFQDSEIETRFTANYWLNLISSREKSSPKKDKTSSKIFSFVRSPRLRFAHATATEAKAEGKKCLQLDVRERKLEMPLTKCVWWLRTDAKSSPFAEFR